MPHELEILAVTGLKDECYIDGCAKPVVAVAAYHSSLHHDVVSVWLCEEHGSAFEAPNDATTDVLVQQTIRTCQRTTEGGSPCGAYATHVVLTGQQYDDDRKPEIRVVSACEQHALAARPQ